MAGRIHVGEQYIVLDSGEDGEYEQREYANKLLADEFSNVSIEEMDEELAFWESERSKRR